MQENVISHFSAVTKNFCDMIVTEQTFLQLKNKFSHLNYLCIDIKHQVECCKLYLLNVYFFIHISEQKFFNESILNSSVILLQIIIEL